MPSSIELPSNESIRVSPGEQPVLFYNKDRSYILACHPNDKFSHLYQVKPGARVQQWKALGIEHYFIRVEEMESHEKITPLQPKVIDADLSVGHVLLRPEST